MGNDETYIIYEMDTAYLIIFTSAVVIIALYAVIMGAWVYILSKYKPETKVKDDLAEILEDIDNQLNYYSYDTQENDKEKRDLHQL